jgi:CRP-like cAMP-binding protein
MSDDRHAEASDPIIEILRKIPIFAGLALPEIQKIFNLCRFKQIGAGADLYRNGASSADLFLLLEGSLGVRTAAGVEISRIYPIGLVGEMGVLTGEPRSADVVALEDVMGLSVHKDDLDDLFAQNAEICRKMLTNVIQALSKKLYNANVQLEQLKNSVPELNKEADELLAGNIFLY